MINANLYSVCKNVEENSQGYYILLSIQSLDNNLNKKLTHFDDILNSLYGKDSVYYKKTNRSIIKCNSFDDIIDYYIPCDIGVIMEILELFTYMRGTNVFLENDFITKGQLTRKNKKELYFQVSEFVKKGIIDLQEKEEEHISEEQLMRSMFC